MVSVVIELVATLFDVPNARNRPGLRELCAHS